MSLALASAASASTTIGQVFVPTLSMPSGSTAFVTGTASVPASTVPSNGVITSFSHIGAALNSPDAKIALAVVRTTQGGFDAVGVSDAHSLVAGQINTFATHIPVSSGDMIGLQSTGSSVYGLVSTGNAGDTWKYTTSTVIAGAFLPSVVVSPNVTGLIMDLSVVIEPDADGDGYGDETQDKCPTDASTQGACPEKPDKTAPVLSVSFAKTQKTKSSFDVGVTSNEASTITVAASLKSSKKGSKPLKLATKTVAGGAGTITPVKLTLTSKAKSALRAKKKLNAIVTITAIDAAGNATTSTLKLTLTAK
jgi:hypothetical protein